MAPRMDRSESRHQSSRPARLSYASSNVQPRLAQASRRSARFGSTTQLEEFAADTAPRPRQSPTSKGNIHLLAATGTKKSDGELKRLHSDIKKLKDGRMNHGSINRFIPSESDSAEALELPEIDSDSSPEEVENMIAHMIDYLLKWTDEKLVEGSATVLKDIKVIHASLQSIMELPEEVLSSFVVRSALRSLRRRYGTFVSIWTQAVHRALIGKLQYLESQVKRHPAALQESAFTSLVSDIRTASSSYALLVFLDSAQDNIPLLVTDDAATVLLDRCARVHAVFQNATYISEQKELWLLIWRGLKAVFTAFEQGGAPTSPTNIHRDRKFIELPGVYREFKRLLSSPDAANPRSIEDMVGKYCRYIYKCQVDTGNKYESLQRPRDTPLESHTKEALREFIQTGKFETSTLSKIHFAVARFNEINGGPVRVRRWQHDIGNGEWNAVALDLLSPVLTQTAERRPGSPNNPSSARSRSSFVGFDSGDSVEDAAQKPSKRLFPYPEGVNVKSAFDYVYYPFPETRAHEVVQHEQISREMSQSGITSEGPRAEFLVNRPPRHARDPGDHSTSNGTIGPFEWIRVAILRLLSHRRRVPDAKHPKVSALPLRRTPSIPALKPRPLPINSKARVRKSTSAATSNLKLRGGGLPPSRSMASSNRKRTFDPLAYQRMMMEIFRRELKSKYHRSVPINEEEMLCLLKQTTYDVGKAVELYQGATRDKSVDPTRNKAGKPRRFVRAGGIPPSQAVNQTGRRQKHSGQTPSDIKAEIYAYRMDAHSRPVTGPIEAPPPVEDGSDDVQNQGQQQPLPRQVLGELPTGAEPRDDDRSDDNTRASSNQENQPPRLRQPPQPPHRTPTPEPNHSVCHPCPMYEGQYHHVCRCLHVVPPGAQTPTDIPEEENPVEGANQNSNAIDIYDEGTPVEGVNQNSNANPANGRGQNDEDNDADQVATNTPCPPPRPNRRPAREEPRADDSQYVREVFANDRGYHNTLGDLGSGGALGDAVRSILAAPPNWITNDHLRGGLRTTMDNLVVEIMTLRNQYLELLDDGPAPFMEAVAQNDVRAPNPDVRATVEILRRAANDARQHYDRLLRFFDEDHPRTNLGFRHQFNRLIRAVRELRHLFLEYVGPKVGQNVPGNQQQQGQGNGTADQEDNQEEGSDDTASDSGSTLSPRERQRLGQHRASPRRYNAVPTRAEYELMFVDELERELRNRGIPDVAQALGKKRYTKADLINKLMALDKEGQNLGNGAEEGYRHITGDLTSRGRPRGWNLEAAVQQHRLNQQNRRNSARQARQQARKQARMGRGVRSPASVTPRAPPNPLRFANGRPATRADSPEVVDNFSEESDTASEDFRAT